MKNGMQDLNDHLFAQLERLSQAELTPEQLSTELDRTTALVSVADRITDNAKTRIAAAKIFAEHGLAVKDILPTVGSGQTAAKISDQSRDST